MRRVGQRAGVGIVVVLGLRFADRGRPWRLARRAARRATPEV
jgi:hypothetical protein